MVPPTFGQANMGGICSAWSKVGYLECHVLRWNPMMCTCTRFVIRGIQQGIRIDIFCPRKSKVIRNSADKQFEHKTTCEDKILWIIVRWSGFNV